MSVDVGIIGLPKSGRTTVFNTLTGVGAETGSYSQAASAHVGVARVADPRLDNLARMFERHRVVPVEMMCIDVGASVKSLAEKMEISGQLLAKLSQVAALINVVRAFIDDSVPNVAGSLDVARDIASMNLELVFSDLSLIDRRLNKIEASLKGARTAERAVIQREQGFLLRIKGELENEVPIREQTLTPEEMRIISGYQFLSAKPLLIVVNVGEADLERLDSLEAALGAGPPREKCRLLALPGKLEMELVQLDAAEAVELRTGYGIRESGLDRITNFCYQLLGLISFLTVGADEVRAWSVPRGTSALKAAGKVHSDMERGFIRAEVISFDNLLKCGSLVEARKKGILQLEGKDYTIKDGDVIKFLFNV